MVDEADRSLHDALSVLSQTVKETRVTLGGGCAEMLMSCAVDEAARTVKGKKALAVEGFARALRQVSVVSPTVYQPVAHATDPDHPCGQRRLRLV
jgi:T-complex protein 1 subunit beta